MDQFSCSVSLFPTQEQTHLVDLIHQRERRSCFFCQTHQVKDGCQGTLLGKRHHKLVKSELNFTNPSRLPLPSQKLQLLLVTELYENVNGPFVVIIVWADPNLASASNPCSSRETRNNCSDNSAYDRRQRKISFQYFPRAYRGRVANYPIQPVKTPFRQ